MPGPKCKTRYLEPCPYSFRDSTQNVLFTSYRAICTPFTYNAFQLHVLNIKRYRLMSLAIGMLTHFCITTSAEITSTGSLLISGRVLSLFAQIQYQHLCDTRFSETMCIKSWPTVSYEPLMRFSIQTILLVLKQPGKAPFNSYFNFSTYNQFFQQFLTINKDDSGAQSLLVNLVLNIYPISEKMLLQIRYN